MSIPTSPCAVQMPVPDPCCVGPCDPPWRSEHLCIPIYETKTLRFPLTGDRTTNADTGIGRDYIEFRITYEHRLCLLGKQLGPLVYTLTLLPGETVKLYHSDRFRQVTAVEDRYSVQTTFMQYLSAVHASNTSNSSQTLADVLTSASGSSSGGGGLDVDLGIISFGGGGSSSGSFSTATQLQAQTQTASDQFAQSVSQSSLLTQAARSIVVSTYQEQDSTDVSVRTFSNANACRAVTYFVRRIMELYSLSTLIWDISYRIVAPGVPADWHELGDVAWLPKAIQSEIAAIAKLLPRVGETVERPKPFAVPTDGVAYDAELAHCCSCEPEREAALKIELEHKKAMAMKACLEAQLLQTELQRRQALLQAGTLASFDPPAIPAAPPQS